MVPLSPRLEHNPWAWGRNCWKVGNARQFGQAIPAKGKLNLYNLPSALSGEARKAMADAGRAVPDAAAKSWVAAMLAADGQDERDRGLFEGYMALQDAEGMLRTAERLVANVGDADAYVDRAAAKVFAKNDRGAFDDLDTALRLDPKNPRALRARKYLRDELG